MTTPAYDKEARLWRAEQAEARRHGLLPTMPAACREAVERGEMVWDTAGLIEDFQVLGFQAPLVVARRRADGQLGTLTFVHQPRYYFGWQPSEAEEDQGAGTPG